MSTFMDVCSCGIAYAPLRLFTDMSSRKSSPHHDVVVDKALAVAGRLQVWVLLSAGDLDVPHTSPSLV